MRTVTQDWTHELTLMQQTVLILALRGADGLAKFHPYKELVRWYRRCVLVAAFEKRVLSKPYEPGGGSFTGPTHDLKLAADWFMDARDEMPAHYRDHFMHGVQILGYKHPDKETAKFWREFYYRMVHALHLWPETEAQMDERLGDTLEGWQSRSDPASTCSD